MENNLTAKSFRKKFIRLSIDLKFSLVPHLQSNGQVELINKIIIQVLKKNLDNAKGLWAEKLPKTLWAYRITHKSSIRETLFELAFGVKVMIPIEVGLPSFQVAYYDEETNDE